MAHHHFPWTDAFLAALAEFPVLSHAAAAVGIDRTTAWRRMQADNAFALEVQEAMEAGVDRAEREAFRRGVVGFEEPVTSQGQLTYLVERDEAGQPIMVDHDEVYTDSEGDVHVRKRRVAKLVMGPNGQPVPLTVRKHSDPLLALILKGRRKNLYAERIEQTGANGGPVRGTIVIATGVPRADDFSDLA